jgi:hypothetical protein
LQLHQVFLFWEEVVGSEIARHTQLQVIRGEILWVAVSDSIWMQQLQFERHHILELLNARLVADSEQSTVSTGRKAESVPRLADLKFTLDSSFARRQQVHQTKTVAQQIDPDQFAQFSASLNSIENLETRESMKRLWLVIHSRPAQQ